MLTLSPQSDREFSRQELFTPNGRTAFKAILKHFGLHKGGTVLIPAYIGISDKEGSGVLDPMEDLGVRYEFYAVDESLSPVMDDLKRRIADKDVAAVLSIHYFGFPSHTFGEVVSLCRSAGRLLIEDCAHALYTSHEGKMLGTFGDAAFFSIHKFLPVDTGGMARVNSGTGDFPADLTDTIGLAALAAYCRADDDAIRATRRDNYEYLHGRLGQIRPFFASLPEGVTPMNFPVWIEGKDRDKTYFALEERGIPTSSLYYALVPQLKESSYPVSFNISRHISNLPIHQSMTHADIDLMLSNLREVLAQ